MKSHKSMPKKAGVVHGPTPKPHVPPPKQKPLAPKPHLIFARVVDDQGAKPVPGFEYEVVDEKGKVIARGKTDHTGMIHHDVPAAGKYHVRRAK